MQSKHKPKISIIMNCHNGERYLKKSLRSIFHQSFKNWELIFFNNCSTDGSLSIINSFKDRRVKVYNSKKFLNLYDARNKALKYAKGKYVSFLDADDQWNKNKLKTQFNFITKKKLKFCYTNFYIKSKNKKILKIKNNIEVNTQSLLNDYNIGILTVMIERKILLKNKFNKKFEIIGDFDLFIKLSNFLKVGFINKPLSVYNNHGNNLSLRKKKLHIKELKYWINNNQLKFKKKKLKINKIKTYLIKLKIQKIFNYST